MTTTTYTQTPASIFATHARTERKEDWLSGFENWLLSSPIEKYHRARNEKTISAYLGDVRQFGAYFERVNHTPFSLEYLNSQDIAEFFQTLKKNAQPSTYNRKRASVQLLVNYAKFIGLIDYDPMAWIPVAVVAGKSPRDLNDEERLQLETAANAGETSLIGMRDSIAFYLMLLGGLRISEVANLKVGDLDFSKGEMRINGKGDKTRYVEIAGRLDEKLRRWLDLKPASAMDALVSANSNKPLTTGQIRRRFEIIRARAGVSESITPHALRHTFVYRYMEIALERNIPWHSALSAISQQTGDDPAVILAYYSRARKSDVKAVMGVM